MQSKVVTHPFFSSCAFGRRWSEEEWNCPFGARVITVAPRGMLLLHCLWRFRLRASYCGMCMRCMQLQYYTFYSEKPAPYLSWLDLTSVQPIWDKLMRIKSSVTDIDLTCNSIVHHVRIGCSIVLWMPFAELHMQRCPLMWSRSQWHTNGVACLLSVGKVHYIMVNRTLGCGLSTRGVRLDWYIMKLCQIMLKDSWQWLSRIVATWLPNLCVQV